MAVHVKRFPIFIAFVLFVLALPAAAQNNPKLSVTSSAFTAGAAIPVGHSCKSPQGESPPLAWKGGPADAQTLVPIVKDPDAPPRAFNHWGVYNLPATPCR